MVLLSEVVQDVSLKLVVIQIDRLNAAKGLPLRCCITLVKMGVNDAFSSPTRHSSEALRVCHFGEHRVELVC